MVVGSRTTGGRSVGARPTSSMFVSIMTIVQRCDALLSGIDGGEGNSLVEIWMVVVVVVVVSE